ncbi:MAG: autotransporter outer membrane beta-barrel domain-containing protein [Burkholderiales bacterium]|nr:autotransporter outer membrane beta-barrel domain-containing protein [Burkholderiales bacterium]
MRTRTLLAGLLLAGAALPAAAQSTDPKRCSVEEPSFCLNGVSNAVTGLDSLRVALPSGQGQRANEEERIRGKQARSGRIVVAASEKISGLGAPDPWALWVGYAHSKYDSSVQVAPYDADLDSYRIGVDRFYAGKYLFGVALIYEKLDTDTQYNGGGQDVDGTTLAPYFSWLIDERFSLDVNAGYAWLDASQKRIDPTGVPGAPPILRSSYDARRWFASATLNYLRAHGNWTFGGRVGYLYSREEQDGYTETGGPSARTVDSRTLRLGQLYVGPDAAYFFGNGLEAYGALLYRYDVTRNDGRDGGGLPSAVGATQPEDKDEWDWSLGLRFYARRNVTLGIEYLRTEGRDKFDNEVWNALARFEF